MSARASGQVWKLSQHKGSELLVLLAIADHAKDDGSDAWPSVEFLAEKTRLSERAVRYVIRKLEASGELVCERNAGPRGANLYHIMLEGAKIAPEKIAPSPAKIAPAEFAGGQPSVSGGGQWVAPKPSLRTVIDKSNTGESGSNSPHAHARFSPTDPVLSDERLEQAVARLGADEDAVLLIIPIWAAKRRGRGIRPADPFEDFIGFGMSYLDIERGRAAPAAKGRASPVTFAQQREINNAKAWEEMDAAVLGRKADHGLRTHVQAADEPPRRRLPAGDPGDDDGGVLDGVFRQR